MLGIDESILELMKKVAMDVATSITVKELKNRILDLSSKENVGEIRRRLSTSLSLLVKRGNIISDKDIFLKLSDYPGLIPILQDEKFRNDHLKLDTGTGTVILDKKCIDVLSSSRTSIEHNILCCLKGWEKEYFYPSFKISLPGTLSLIESKLPEGQLKINYQKESLRFDRETSKEFFELTKSISKITKLELAVKDYKSEVQKTLTKTSDLLYEYIKEYDKLMDSIHPKITHELKKDIGQILFFLHQRLLIFISGLDFIAKINNIEWHGRGD